MQIGDEVFISYPHCVHWQTKGDPASTKGSTAINQLLWGDYAVIRDIDGDWFFVRSRRKKRMAAP